MSFSDTQVDNQADNESTHNLKLISLLIHTGPEEMDTKPPVILH